jgi:glucosamine--fructose-6-phosphate aminotransferase (isomerizing)
MCGIIGYLGPGDGVKLSLKGLERLEYRGYDSVGLAAWQKEKIICKKIKGRVADLYRKIFSSPELKNKSNLVIAHNRWATHGEPSEINAHPQNDCSQKIFLVHNGVIENYQSLKKWLQKRGHSFSSQTDTEVIVHLIEEHYQGDLLKAVQKTLPLLTGAYGLAVISESEPNHLVVAKKGSPLVIGICKKGEYIVASDPVAIIEHTRRIIYLDDGEIGDLSLQRVKITNCSNSQIKKEIESIEWDLTKIEKEGFSHFMLKEIFKQPETIKNAFRGRINRERVQVKLGGLKDWFNFIVNCPRVVFLACGTSWHAGLIGKYYFENLVGLPANAEYASEFRYSEQPIDPQVAYFVISQSGETADTLASLRKIKEKGGHVFGLVNVVGSTIAREADAGVYIHAGPEIGVASTKAFTSQVTLLSVLALSLVLKKRLWPLSRIKKCLVALEKIPQQVEEVLGRAEQIKVLASRYYQFQNALYLGREYNFPVALEGALKLKEISYIHAEGYPAAEIKHGPIALIDQNMPTFVVATNPDDLVYQKVVTNIEEIKARGGRVLALINPRDKIIKNLVDEIILVPQTFDFLSPIINIIPWQLWSYYVAVQRGCDVDKPRNLAKSVTVE